MHAQRQSARDRGEGVVGVGESERRLASRDRLDGGRVAAGEHAHAVRSHAVEPGVEVGRIGTRGARAVPRELERREVSVGGSEARIRHGDRRRRTTRETRRREVAPAFDGIGAFMGDDHARACREGDPSTRGIAMHRGPRRPDRLRHPGQQALGREARHREALRTPEEIAARAIPLGADPRFEPRGLGRLGVEDRVDLDTGLARAGREDLARKRVVGGDVRDDPCPVTRRRAPRSARRQPCADTRRRHATDQRSADARDRIASRRRVALRGRSASRGSSGQGCHPSHRASCG